MIFKAIAQLLLVVANTAHPQQEISSLSYLTQVKEDLEDICINGPEIVVGIGLGAIILSWLFYKQFIC
jgi:hypothetical protein